ncbi:MULTISPECIES: hypothetical protein [Amycolatopsis]|uniref:VOC domain-containing protein n=2 Tax=Amycolatopsis TaxID=1813 RepID=A0A1I4BJ66_9PSEU|nr:hypothetical protein [Amycolatopsis sacchari]SFK68039.1 hypothetical protein SAMN05421835_12874 [Amycolatopsis sacchari]
MKVFGYTYDPLRSGFPCATLKVGGRVVGGIGQLSADVPQEVPAYWGTYFGVADTDEAVAVELGAAVVRAAQNPPYGRSAQLTDHQGMPFTVISVQG